MAKHTRHNNQLRQICRVCKIAIREAKARRENGTCGSESCKKIADNVDAAAKLAALKTIAIVSQIEGGGGTNARRN